MSSKFSEKMIGKIKYLNLVVLLTFLVGQIQFVYASYFCTMKNAPMTLSSKLMSKDDSCCMACAECSNLTQMEQGRQTINGNCMQLRFEQKMVVDNFTDSHNDIQHFVTVAIIGDQLSMTNFLAAADGCRLFNRIDHPPVDIPTLNSNLRI